MITIHRVPEPQEILKLETVALDNLSVLSKLDPHLRARQGSQRPRPTLEETPSGTRTHTQPGPTAAPLAGRQADPARPHGAGPTVPAL